MSNSRFMEYEDNGCTWHPKCLECSESICRLDNPRIKRSKAKDKRKQLVTELVLAGISPSQAARQLKLSKRTVFRYLEEDRVKK